MRTRVMRGFGWVGAMQIVLQITRTIGAIAVARLLAPEQYGLAMLALVFASLVLVFSDLAFGAALVQRKQISEDDRCTAFWITVGSGVLFTVLGVLLSGAVASLYGQPRVAGLLAALSASFLLTALGATQQSLLLREMSFKKTEILGLAGALAGTVAAVVLAALGTGAWAIIGQQLVTATLTSALMWRASSWRPQLRFSRASLMDLGGFSAFLVGHRLLYYVHQNADRFIIGRFLGAPALGSYAVAYNVMLQPVARIASPVQRVLAPAFARMQDEPERIAAAWARAARLVGMLAVS
jgi:O-antigen/teichoic acid export membrane protein